VKIDLSIMSQYQLYRFLDAQDQNYLKALSEIKNGQKVSHWMWYVFPQLRGLGRSETAVFYGISGANEAIKYIKHPVLGKHLIEISSALLNLSGTSATAIFGTPDDLKLRSCMTLFANLPDANVIFEQVLLKYFNGDQDQLTLQKLQYEFQKGA